MDNPFPDNFLWKLHLNLHNAILHDLLDSKKKYLMLFVRIKWDPPVLCILCCSYPSRGRCVSHHGRQHRHHRDEHDRVVVPGDGTQRVPPSLRGRHGARHVQLAECAHPAAGRGHHWWGYIQLTIIPAKSESMAHFKTTTIRTKV